MRKLLLIISALFLIQMSYGQLSGIKTIPGDYATIQAAVTALNAQGVGTGGVTFNVAAGYTESITSPISLTATGTLANPIIFQKSGGGANPLITGYTGTSTPSSAVQDGIWNFVGSDYVTISGINLYDPNSTNPATMEYGFSFFPAATDNGCQNNQIINCVVTLSRENNASGSGPSTEGSRAINLVNALVTTQTTALTPTAASGTNSNNKFYSNTLQNCNYGIVVYGYAAATPFNLGDTGNDIGGSSGATGNSILNFGGATGATNPSAAIRATNQWGINISYNTINNNNGSGVNHVSTLRGIYAQSGTSANANINNNTVTIKGGGTTSQVAMIENVIGSTAAGNTVNINNNNLTGDYLTATTGAFYGIFSSASAATVNINNNTLTNLAYSNAALTGSGVVYPIYNTGAATVVNANGNTVSNITRTGTTGSTTIGIYLSSGTTQTVNNNTVSNMSIDGAGTGSTMYGIQVAGTTVTVNGNLVHTLTCIKTTGTGALYGIYDISSPTNENYNNNIVRDLTHNGTGIIYGIYTYTTTGTRTVSGNQIYNLSGAGTTIIGINQTSSSPNIFKNKIYNIQSLSTGAPTVAGIQISSLGTSGLANVYNNLIGDIKAPAASSSGPTAPSVRGINLTTTTTASSVNLSFNTIYLNATSTGANFSTAGLFVTTSTTSTSAALTLKNNVIINKSTPAGTGLTVAYQRSSTALANFTNESNNNLYFAGTPGATRLVHYDGTNLVQTLASYKSLVTPREAASITEDANFKSVSGSSADFLHINESIPTQIESCGIPVTGITDDFDGQARNASTPDLGADEFGGILLDITPPGIAFTPLPNTSSTNVRTLTTAITDATGVPASGIGLPVLYWRINSGSWISSTANYVSGNTYTFNFGAGVVLGDVVSYYIVAQDLVTPTPNVGVIPSGGASGLSYNPPACSTPPTSPFTYTIVGTLSGVYPVGAGQVYATLTAAVADLNFKEVVGPVTFELWDASYPSETFPLLIGPYAGMDPTRPVTFKPKAGVAPFITGAPTTGIIVLYGCQYVTLDGSNTPNGTDKSLTWENINTASNAYVIGVFNNGSVGASNCTIKNCNIKASSQVSNNTYGIILNAAGGGYNNIVIENNTIYSARYGMQFAGIAGNPATNGKVINNIIGSTIDAEAIQYRGIVLSQADNTLIQGNEIIGAPLGNTNTYQSGIYIIAGSTNNQIIGNKIHDFYYTGTSGYGNYGIYYGGDATTPNVISNNVIYAIKSDGDPGSANYIPSGIYVYSGGNLKIYHNSINLTGATLSASYTTSYSACINIYSGIVNLDIRDNILKNSMTTAAGTGSNLTYAIYSATANTVFSNINYNDYWVNGLNPNIGYLGGNQSTLALWRTATGQDVNSQNIDPIFTSDNDLLPTNGALDNLGFYLTAVPKDFNGIMRTNPPDMGAYEFGTNPTINTLAATDIYCYGGRLNGTINANGLVVNSFFDYGLTTAYGNSVPGTPATVTGTSVTPVTAVIAMPASTTYHFRIKGVTSNGVTSYGPDMTLTTLTTGAPLATTLAATTITDNSAILNGIVNGLCNSTVVVFEYGLSTSYGSEISANQSPVTGFSDVPVDVNLTGLTLNTTYHYRVKATSSLGTTYGADVVFTSGANPPVVVTNAASNIGNFTARLNGTVTASNQNSTVTFQYGLTTSYGTTVSGVPAVVSGNSPVAVYADITGLAYNTTYHFRCVAQNPAGTTYGGDQVFTTLCPVPEPAGTITGPTSVCQSSGGNVYTVPPINYAYSGYVWTVPTGGNITAGAGTNSITVSYSSSAVSGDVTVYGTSICGNGAPSTLAVTVNPIPVPTIAGENEACITHDYTYSTESGMSGYTWAVSGGGQILSGSGTSQVVIRWNSAGAQTVSITYTSAAGCPAESPTVMNVTVGGLPTPSIAGSNKVCVNSGLHVYTTQQGFSGYQWTVTTGGTIVSGQGTYQIEVNWTGGGNKTVSVNYATSFGCYAAAPATFAVTVMPVPAVPGQITGTHGLCAGATGISYSVAAVPDALGYVWELPYGATIVGGENTNNILVDFAPDAASGNIRVAAENYCGVSGWSQPYAVTVNPIPETPVATVDEFYMLHSSSAEGNQWYFEGEMIDGATEQDYQATEEGIYYTIVTLEGCVSDPSNEVEVIFVGMDEMNGTGFSIFPIPNDGKFVANIAINGEDLFSIKVYSDLGVKVYERTNIRVNGKAQIPVDLNNPGKGVYTVVLQGDNQTFTRKMLVTR